MIFKKGSRVIRVIDRANDRRCRPSNPLLDSPWTARLSHRGTVFCPRTMRRCVHNATPSRIHYATRPGRCAKLARNAFEKESSRREGIEEKERVEETKRKKKRDIWLMKCAVRGRKKKKKESLRPAQLRIRTSPSILITGHGRKEFVKILNVRAFFRADN